MGGWGKAQRCPRIPATGASLRSAASHRQSRPSSKGAVHRRGRHVGSRLDRVRLEVVQIDELQGRDVRRFENDRRGDARLEGLFPAGRTEAPAIARLQARESHGRLGSGKIVAGGFREFEELLVAWDTDHVQADVAQPFPAGAVPDRSPGSWAHGGRGCGWELRTFFGIPSGAPSLERILEGSRREGEWAGQLPFLSAQGTPSVAFRNKREHPPSRRRNAAEGVPYGHVCGTIRCRLFRDDALAAAVSDTTAAECQEYDQPVRPTQFTLPGIIHEGGPCHAK